jgi:hypothetical protein
MIKKMKSIHITKKQFLFIVAAIVLLRLILTAGQELELMPEETMFDDMLYYNGARHIVDGNWLGDYNYLTMGKYMGFSLWLAMLYELGISILFAGHVLSCISCIVMLWAVSPVIKNNLMRVAFFAVLVFCPALYASYTLRIYRDNITVSFILLTVACVIGMAFRYREKKMASFYFFAVSGGLSTGASALLREDSYWLWPFVIAGFLVMLFMLFFRKGEKKWHKTGLMAAFCAIAFICVGAWCGMNYKYYGRFIVSDFTSKESQAAYGAITRIKVSDDVPLDTPIPYEYRQQLYAASPTLATIEPYLENDCSIWQKDNGAGELDFSGSALYWAVRSAASYAGYYETPQKAQEFYEQVAQELNAAYETGVLEAATGKRSALNTPFSGKYVLPTLEEMGNSVFTVATYQNLTCDPYLAIGPPELLEEITEFVHCDAVIPTYIENDDTLIRFWAYSDNGNINISVRDADGKEVPADLEYSSGGDLYYEFLHQGKMQYCYRYSFHITHDSSNPDYFILISDGINEIVIPANKMPDQASQHGLVYKIEYVGNDYTTAVNYHPIRLFLYRALHIIVYVYMVISPILLLCAFVMCVISIVRALRRKREHRITENALLGWVTAGILFTALLRIAMVSLVEVSMAGIGTFPMYLSAVYPLFLIFSFLAVQLFFGVRQPTAPQM